ncbi:MAG: SUMF1/EgtB/PvdO family nonheme iron enzyme, partial [Deltaproteobacteria bacterium]|nr:SUMF1/EgtB/PvdO family nonheme iron enzyme [Deltaproteobacteria bacterium]
VSYSRADDQFAKNLITLLREHYGYENVWYDQRLHAGADWWAEILRRIAWSDVLQYLLSNDSVESKCCRAEYTEATRLRKPAVFVQGRGKTPLPADLSRYHYLDMSSRGVNDGQALTALYNSIHRQAKLPAKRAAWQPATPHPDEAEHLQPVSEAAEVSLAVPQVPPGAARATGTQPVATPRVATQPPPPARSSAIVAAVATLIALGMGAGWLLSSGGENDAAEDAQAELATPTASQTQPGQLATEVAAAPEETEPAEPNPTAMETATLTPTVMVTPTPTFTPTLTPLEAALQRAQAGVTRNADWEPFVQEFDGVEMVLVPAGCFMMGSDDGDSDERPVHEQCFDEPFWIDRYEVTQADFERLGGQKANANWFDGADRPVERITWFEARDFCDQREMRLPTEREWEYAARGPDNLVYPWGDSRNANNAVWDGNSGGRTAKVGSISSGVSWVGALDLSGNVWEWTKSVYENYPYEPDDRREADQGDGTDVRVLRGGSFDGTSYTLHAANRNGLNPRGEYNDFGLRCARSLEQP